MGEASGERIEAKWAHGDLLGLREDHDGVGAVPVLNACSTFFAGNRLRMVYPKRNFP